MAELKELAASLKPFVRNDAGELDTGKVEAITQLLNEMGEQLLASADLPASNIKDDLVAMLMEAIARLDETLSNQLNEILHNEKFKALEASWRGLFYLVQNTETSTMLKLRLLPATKKELLSDLEKATEFDQSALFKKVYEEEYGTFGGNPFSLMIGDYEFGRHPQDMALLEKISGVAAAAHAPFISAAAPALFDMESFTELGNPRDLAKIFESTELIKWRSFRDSEDSRYVTLTLPHILLRLPYGPETTPVEEFFFVEDVPGKQIAASMMLPDKTSATIVPRRYERSAHVPNREQPLTDHNKYLWGNAAYALGVRITTAFAKYKWCAAIRGVEGGGLVEGLPVHTFLTDEGEIAAKIPTEIAITDRREKELSDLGFLALAYAKNTDYAAFFGGQTTNKPKVYNTPQATANARLSASLPYLLAASRFAHYFKVIMRDKIGSFMTKDNVQSYLNVWIGNYVLSMDNAGQDLKAQYPLREARVDVTDIPGKPGCYKAIAFLRPHFQLEELTVSIRLVAELPPPAA